MKNILKGKHGNTVYGSSWRYEDAGNRRLNMTITRHISIDDDYIEKMKPYLERHNGNFGAAIREMIYEAGKHCPFTNSSAMDVSLFNWMIEEVDDTLVPDDILDELIDPVLIASMEKLEEYLNRKFSELEWGVNLSLKYDTDMFPSNMVIEIRGSPHKVKFAACIISQYIVKNSLEHAPLEIRSVINLNECIKVELSRSSKKDAQKSLVTFFGGMDDVIKTIKSRPDFWKAIIKEHILSGYNMVTVHRNYLEDLLANNIPLGEITIETLARKPLHDIPLKEMLSLIKEVYETSRIVDKVEINNDTLILFHTYRNKQAIEQLKKIIITLLEESGHLYDAKSTANMIVLRHRPDVGVKMNEIVNVLKTSNSSVDQELVMFMAFLKGLKDIPDIPLTLTALSRRIGISLMQEYEKENDIKTWSLETFKKALEMVDSKLHRESEWKLEGENLQYTVKRCNITTEGDKFDTYICRTARETFKGALNYAIGNKAVLDVKKLVTHGDNFCEVVIRLQ